MDLLQEAEDFVNKAVGIVTDAALTSDGRALAVYIAYTLLARERNRKFPGLIASPEGVAAVKSSMDLGERAARTSCFQPAPEDSHGQRKVES